jgi:hypothetical protein
MSDQLDRLLDQVREPEPVDEGFVQRVMADVRTDEYRRRNIRGLRRPMVFGLVAAAVVTGGAVAAVVGGNSDGTKTEARASDRPAAVTESVEPAPKPSDLDASGDGSASPKAGDKVPADELGFGKDHTARTVDEKTGLSLTIETYVNEFTVGKSHRVTLTLENTGDDPLLLSGAEGCGLQVMASPAGEADPASYADPEDRFEWVCAGSDRDPRAKGAVDETFVLAPGATRTADASLVLTRAGAWNVVGTCRCSYTISTPDLDETDPFSGLSGGTLPSPLVPDTSDGKDIATPPVRVRAR